MSDQELNEVVELEEKKAPEYVPVAEGVTNQPAVTSEDEDTESPNEE